MIFITWEMAECQGGGLVTGPWPIRARLTCVCIMKRRYNRPT